MKLNKSSILALMTLGGLMAFGPLASADDSSTKPVPPPDAPSTPPSDATPPAAGGRRGGGMNLDRIAEQLKLTDDQKEKVKPVLKEMGDKMRELRQDTSVSAQERRPKMKEIRDAADAKMKTILSDDQYAQWQKMAQARGGRRKNAAPPPADSSTTPPATNDNK